MKIKKHFRKTAISFLLLIVVLATTTAFVDKYYYVDKKLLAIESVINNYYVGDVNAKKLQEGIYKGFVNGVGDIYTNYYTAEEYASFMEKSSGVYAGIGIQMSLDNADNTIMVVDVFEGSPAQEVGMLPNDKIIKVEGQTVTGEDFSSLPSMVKGEPGTKVKVTVYRPSEDKSIDFDVERRNITTASVESKMLEDSIGYIKIVQFEEITYDQFKASLDELQAENMQGLIIDVRNNPGGLLKVTEKIADELVPAGVVVSTENKVGKNEVYYADDEYINIPIVVLVNGNSASASEVLAGAIKDTGRGKLVGETTFGKGVVQSVIPLSDGSALKVTTAKYFTPSGVCIQGIGIEPDFEVTLPVELLTKSKLTEEEDVQLQKALEVLKEELD
nr:S41 family peptidase [uncultured Cellulosilyticum sp.]